MKKIVEELNQSANGHTVVDILYREHTIRKFRARRYLGGVFARPLALSTTSHCRFIVEKPCNDVDNITNTLSMEEGRTLNFPKGHTYCLFDLTKSPVQNVVVYSFNYLGC